jgi:hypothetical protein
MKQVTYLAIFVFLMYSCADLRKEKQLAAITTIEKGLDSLENVMKKEKIDSLSDMRVAAESVEFRIRNNYKLDTINLEFGKKMDAYKRMRRAIPKLSGNKLKVKKGIDEMRKSLQNLKTDIENGSGKRDKYDDFIKFEKNKFNQLCILYKDAQDAQKKILQTYSTLHPELYTFSMSLIDSLNAK